MWSGTGDICYQDGPLVGYGCFGVRDGGDPGPEGYWKGMAARAAGSGNSPFAPLPSVLEGLDRPASRGDVLNGCLHAHGKDMKDGGQLRPG